MTAADLARIYGVSIRTIRRWAARDNWRRQPGRPVIYYLADVERTLRTREARRIARIYGIPPGLLGLPQTNTAEPRSTE